MLNVQDMYSQLKSQYGDVLGIKLNNLVGRVIVTTFPVVGLKYKHISKTKCILVQSDNTNKTVKSSSSEFDQYVRTFLGNNRDVLGSKDIRAYTNVGFMKRWFKDALDSDNIHIGDFRVINRNDLDVYKGDYLIWLRVIDKSGNIVTRYNKNECESWALDYMVCKIHKGDNRFPNRYLLRVFDSPTRTVCELCGNVKDDDNLPLKYKRVKRHGSITREENYCGCYNEYGDRYTCIEETAMDNKFRKLLVSKGYLVYILNIYCNYEYGDAKCLAHASASINIQIARQGVRLDNIFSTLGFMVHSDALKPYYSLYKGYSNLIQFLDDISKLYNNLNMLPSNSVYLFKGYKRDIKDWKSISIKEVDLGR